MKNLLFVLIIGFSLYSCNKVDCPNEVGCVEPSIVVDTNCTSIEGIDTCILAGDVVIHKSDSIKFQKIVIEEYTGFKCTNCPKGAREIDRLKGIYGDTLISVSIHAGSFAKPGTSGGHEYVTDFRTDAGDEYNDFFLGPGAGYPNGIIQRTKFNGTDYSPTDETQWENAFLTVKSNLVTVNPPEIALTSYLSESTRKVLVKANVLFNEATSNNHRIIFLCLEDGVVDVQLDGADFIEDYEHKHVLRGAMNNSAGELINESPVAVNESKEAFSTYFDLAPNWDINNIEIVAMLVNVDSKEIVQAEVVHLK